MAEPYFFRGLAKFYLEDYKGAEEDCSLAIERHQFIIDAYEVRGLSRLSIGKYKEAVTDYDFGLKYYPENRTFMLNKAIAQEKSDDYAGALATYDDLLKKFPRYDQGYLGRARLYLVQKDTVAAFSDANRCVELNENNTSAYLLRADIELNANKNYENALYNMDKAIKLEPKHADLFINRAFIKYNLDDYFGAMSDFDYAIGLEPNNVPAHFNRGLLRMEVSDNDKAIIDFSFVIDKEPDNYKALYNRAVIYQDLGKYDLAIADYNKVIDNFTYLSSLYYARSECKRRKGDMQGGERDYNKWRELLRNHEERKHQISDDDIIADTKDETPEDVIKKFTALETVDNDESIKPEYDNKYRGKIQNYDIAVDIESDYVLSYYDSTSELRENSFYQKELDEINSGYYLRGRLYVTNSPAKLTQQQIDTQFELIRHYSSLLDNPEKRAVDYFGRALSYIAVKNYEAAIQDLTAAVSLSPQFALAYFARAEARKATIEANHTIGEEALSRLEHNSLMKEVFADLDKVAELSPKLAYVYFNKGNLYYNEGDYTAAISCYTLAINEKPDFAEALYNRGIAYFRLGNQDKGLADLSRAGELGVMSSYNVIKRMRKQN